MQYNIASQEMALALRDHWLKLGEEIHICCRDGDWYVCPYSRPADFTPHPLHWKEVCDAFVAGYNARGSDKVMGWDQQIRPEDIMWLDSRV